MTLLKTSLLAAALVAGLAVSANAITLDSTDGPQERGAAPQAGSQQGRDAFASTVAPAGVRIETQSQRVDIQ